MDGADGTVRRAPKKDLIGALIDSWPDPGSGATDLMAIRHHYTILCENAIQGSDGKLSLINIFQNIDVEQFPGVMARMFLVVSLQGEPGQEIDLSIGAPGRRKPLVRIVQELGAPPAPLEPDRQYASLIIGEIRMAVFPAPGTYQIVVRSASRIIHRHSFGVLPRQSRIRENHDTTH